MTVFLKQSTAIDIRVGPFVDVGDGFTPETGVTIGASDEAEILKANGAATVAMAGTLAAVTGCDGWYDYTLSTGDTDTVGELVIVMQDDSVYLPVFVRATVVEEAVYDAMYGAAAAGPLLAGTDTIGSAELAASAVNEIARAIGIQTNTAFSNIEFLMVDSTDHVTPKTGLSVTGERSIDGGAFAAVSGSIAEVSDGIYQFDALAADLNGTVITFRFSGTAADDTFITVKTVA